MFSDQSLLQRFHSLERYRVLALAVSGGVDSLALLYLIAQWKKHLERGFDQRSEGQKFPEDGDHLVSIPQIHVLSVNHGLRAEAGEECAFVMETAQRLGFVGKILSWEGEKPRSGIQEAARKARYELLAEYCAEHQIQVLLTAHQLEDQVETFLMRLARGGGVDSLSGIAKQRCGQHGLIIQRPLLDVPKQSLKDYLQRLNKVWVEDPSNQNAAYERIAIRKNLSALEAVNVSAVNVGKTAERLQRARLALEQMAQRLYERKVHYFALPVFFFEADVLKTEPEELVIRLFRLIFEKMSFAQGAPELKQLEAMVAGFLQGDFQSATLSGCAVQQTAQGIYIYREIGRFCAEEGLKPALQNVWTVWDQRFKVMVSDDFKKPIFMRPLGEAAFAGFRKGLEKRLDLPHYIRKMPASVGGSMLSFWQGETLIALPVLDYYDQGFTKEDIMVKSLISP